MSPWNSLNEAGVREHLREEGVSGERVGPGIFASIDIRLAGIACGVDKECWFFLAQEFQQDVEFGVINLSARERSEVLLAFAEGAGKSFADITGGTKKQNHTRVGWQVGKDKIMPENCRFEI